MSLQLLKDDISSRNFRRIYYICGQEAYLKHFYFGELKTSLLGNASDHPDCITREGSDLTLSELNDIVSSYPLIAEKKVLILIDLKTSDTAADWLASHINELEDNVVVIIYQISENIDMKTSTGKKLKKLILEYGLWVDIDALDSQTLRKWVAQQFRKRKRNIDADLINYLLSQTSADMYSLLNEIDKLASYCQNAISKEAIDTITTKTIDAKTYELTDAIFEKDKNKAFSVLKKLFDMRTNEILIMASVYSSVTTVYKIKLLTESGLSVSELESELGQKGFVLNRNISRSKKIGRTTLEQMLSLCAETDIASKSTSSNLQVMLAELISSLINLI